MSKYVGIAGVALMGGAALAYGVTGYTLPLANPPWFWGTIYFVTTVCLAYAFVIRGHQ